MKICHEKKAGILITMFAICGLSLLLHSGVGFGAELKSYPERLNVEGMSFDVEGGVDSVNVDSGGSIAKPRNIIVNGKDYTFTDDVEFFDQRGNLIESDAMFIGKYVGLMLDPGNRILKLVVLKDKAPQITDFANQVKEPRGNKPSKAHDGTVTLEGGVWKN